MAIDHEAEGLLEGAEDRGAAAHDRLALLPVERVLAGDWKLYA